MDINSKKAREDNLIEEHKKEGVSWEAIRGDVCKLIEFIPFEKSQTRPRAFVIIQSSKYAKTLTMPVFHKDDLTNLEKAIKERQGKQEILISWYDKYNSPGLKLVSTVLPKLVIMICNENAFEFITDRGYRQEIQGEERWNAQKPIKEFRPDVLK